MPLVEGDVLRVAERLPHPSGVDAGVERVRGRATTEVLEHDVARHHGAVGLPEHLVDGSPELTHAHRTSVTTNAPAGGPARAFGCSGASAHREVVVELGDEVVGQRVGDRGESLDDRETVSDLTHDGRDRGVECVGHRCEDLGAGLLLTTLHLAEVPESNAGLGRDLTEGPALLQAEVPQHVADLLTNENHVDSSSLSSPRPPRSR
ncbi:hypothetical protein Cus16_3139 [Curtobacterium sp. ER1/6]|nr:hypothetical protein Cus16_3139 [Curtobacterium sp. ER1/6]